MDAAALALITKAMESGNPLVIGMSLAYLLVFGYLLVGIRRDLHSISTSMKNSFAAGDQRFVNLENRMDVLEKLNQS